MYDMCTSDLSWFSCMNVYFRYQHVWNVYIRSFLLNYGFLVSTCFFMYDMCTSDLSFWTMVSWSLPDSSCMTCVHQISTMGTWLPGLSCRKCVNQIFPSELWFLGHYLVLHVWHVYIRSFPLNYGFLVYMVIHVWHVYIRSFFLNYGFLVSNSFFMYEMFTSDMNYGFLVYLSFMYEMCTSDLSFWTMVSWSLPGPSCMTCVHQIFPSELWFFGLYLVPHV